MDARAVGTLLKLVYLRFWARALHIADGSLFEVFGARALHVADVSLCEIWARASHIADVSLFEIFVTGYYKKTAFPVFWGKQFCFIRISY